MTELFLVRHGETEWSKSGQHTSTTDLPLTEHGREQAELLNGRLDPHDFGLILTSPRLRARETARLAGFTGEAAPEVSEDLVEWAYGEYEGRTSPDIRKTRPDWDLWRDGCPGGESPADVVERLIRVVDTVRNSGAERSIAFAHGHALRVLTLCWLGLDVTLGDQFPLHTATISVLGWEKNEPALQRWNAPVG